MKTEAPSFVSDKTIKRLKNDKMLRAFDADGVEHTFTPEFHVSHESNTMNISEFTFYFSTNAQVSSLANSSIALKKRIATDNRFTSPPLRIRHSTRFPSPTFKICLHARFKTDFAASIWSSLAVHIPSFNLMKLVYGHFLHWTILCPFKVGCPLTVVKLSLTCHL